MKIIKDIKHIQNKMIEKRIPIAVNIELTHRCNYNCIHCLRDIRTTPELSTEEIIDILHQLKKAGTLELAITGGEALLREDIWEILDEVKRLKFSTTFFTNGSLATEDVAKRLSKYNLRAVDISIYGMDPKIHEKVTTVPGSFNKLMETIDLLQTYNLPIRLKMLLFNFNVDELPKVYEFAMQKKLQFSFDELIFIADSGSAHPLMYTVYGEQIKFIEKYRLKLSSRERIWVDYSVEKRSGARLMCTAGRTTAAITPDGYLLPCIVWRTKIGNLRKTQFKVLWKNSKKIKKILDIDDKNFVKCITCRLKANCRVCPGMNETEYKNPFVPSPQKCRLTEIKTEVLDEYKQI